MQDLRMPLLTMLEPFRRVGDKTIAMNLEETKTGIYLKLVEAVEKRVKRSVYIPISCVVPFASAVMEFSAVRYGLCVYSNRQMI